MSKLRVIGVTVLVVIVVALAGLWLLSSRLDEVVARAIEQHGSRATGTSVTVGEVELKLGQGRVTISDLRVANPEGFSDRAALALGRLVLDIKPGSLVKQPYVVQDLDIREVSVLFEVDDQARRNLEVIRDALESGSDGGAESSASDDAAEPPLLVVERLHQSGGQVEADASAVGAGTRTVELPGFTLEDLGAPDGAPATVIGKQALGQIITQAVRAAVEDQLQGAVKDKLGDLLDR